MSNSEPQPSQHSSPVSRRHFFIVLIVFLAFAGLFSGVALGFAFMNKDRVLPGVFVGQTPVGGLTRAEVHDELQSLYDKIFIDGARISFDVEGAGIKTVVFYPVRLAGEESTPLLHIDIDKETDALLAYGKEGTFLQNFFTTTRAWLHPTDYRLRTVALDREAIISFLERETRQLARPARDASIRVRSREPLSYIITTSSVGVVFTFDTTVAALEKAWSELTVPEVVSEANIEPPNIDDRDIQELVASLPQVWQDSIHLTYEDTTVDQIRTWQITPDQIADWISLLPGEESALTWGLEAQAVSDFFHETVADIVNIKAEDARFEIEVTGKVSLFQASTRGRALDVTTTYEGLNTIIMDRAAGRVSTTTMNIAVIDVEPAVSTAAVNDLGITEVLGVGVSNFLNSPKNRILNIKNGAKKLHGLLIKPDEEFSAIEALKPFTLEGGYLPELVIKGSKITPEIGGGLCQLGTTLFRMAMNSGMDITKRQNHSLVVSYYNDPRNGNPGTDATIYEPAPDFRFKNDTGHYLLMQTEVREATGDLIFTLWGQPDGRKGTYTSPVVERWIPYGEAKTIESTTLAPGEKNCQKAFRGAEASFTYTRTLPDGTVIDRVFSSYYRPLPPICLVGVEPTVTCAEGETCLPPVAGVPVEALPPATSSVPNG